MLEFNAALITNLISTGAAVVAATAAIFVPWRVNANAVLRDNAEKETQARCLATALWLQGTAIELNIAAIREEAERIKVGTVAQPNNLFASRDSLSYDFKLNASPVLLAQTDKVWLLGPNLGPKLMELASLIVVYNATVEEGINSLYAYPSLPGDQTVVKIADPKVLQPWESKLDEVASLLINTQADLLEIHDGGPIARLRG